RRTFQAGRRQDFPARPGGGGPCPHGKRCSCRKDHPDRVRLTGDQKRVHPVANARRRSYKNDDFPSFSMRIEALSARRRGSKQETCIMATTPLMPKATAVWLVDNTTLTFEQIAEFCRLHPLEVRAIADGDAAQGIKGMDPVITGQLTREEIARGEADPNYRLKLSEPKVRVPETRRKGPRY